MTYQPKINSGNLAGKVALLNKKCEEKITYQPKINSGGLAGKVALFNKKCEVHEEKQKINPFSKWDGASHRQKLHKDDENYGRPVQGSKTEWRGLKAGELVSSEIRQLCQIIQDMGEEDEEEGIYYIPFGPLFEIYNRISNKLVGILMRARKHGLIHFEGEMLFQRQHDHVMIILLPDGVEIAEKLKNEIAEAREHQRILQEKRAKEHPTESGTAE